MGVVGSYRPTVKILRGERSGRKKVFLQNEPIMSFRINKSNGFVLGSFGFDMLKKAIDRGLGRLCAIGKQETSAGKGPARQRAGLESCRYLRQECLPYLRQECLSLPNFPPELQMKRVQWNRDIAGPAAWVTACLGARLGLGLPGWRCHEGHATPQYPSVLSTRLRRGSRAK